jgi:hypothetical protein
MTSWKCKMSDDKTKVPQLLSRLFSAFPTAARADDMLSARTYLEALEGYSVEAIERSVEQFIRGKVQSHDGRFAPSAAELARNVGQWQDAIRVVEAARNPPLMASGILKVDFGDGVIDMTRLSLEEQNEVLRTGKAPALTMAGLNLRFQRVTDKGRGYSVGSPESDEFAA